MLTNRNAATAVVVAACVLFAGGCAGTKYYKVADPQSGRVYYTKELEKLRGGAVALRDGKSGQTVTIQNSEVSDITKQTYNSSVLRSGENPAEVQAAAARAEALAAEARAAEARAQEMRIAEAKAQQATAAEAKAAREAEAKLASEKITVAAAKSSATMQQFRDQLSDSKDQIDRTLSALNDLADPAQTDLKAAYKRYDEQVAQLKAQAAQAKAESDLMKQAREAYFAKWDARIAGTDNPTIRAEAEGKRARLRDAQEKIAADSAIVKEAYEPFIADINDTQKFLSTEVSKDTVSVLSPTVKKANDNGKILKGRIDDLIADLDAVEGKADAGIKPVPANR